MQQRTQNVQGCKREGGTRLCQESPEGVAHGAEAENDVQVVAHALDEVGEETVGRLRHQL